MGIKDLSERVSLMSSVFFLCFLSLFLSLVNLRHLLGGPDEACECGGRGRKRMNMKAAVAAAA